MKIHFWGVRGSIPTGLTSQQIQTKITAAVERITPRDIESEDARERFLAKLPEWIFGTVGGNTACVELTGSDGSEIILDAGSGIRSMGKRVLPENLHYDLFFSHFHWDHIQGLPFFDPIYNPAASFDIYSAFPGAEKILSEQMKAPYYPVTWSSLTKNIVFHTVVPGTPFTLHDGIHANSCKMFHPGNSYSFSFEENGKKFVYATDVELLNTDFGKRDDGRAQVFENADVLVFDSQYTAEEATVKEKWGHSAFCSAIDFAVSWHVKSIYLFHHEPVYDDKKIHSILQAARWYANYITHDDIKVYLAVEGQELEI